jgi:hypothetical protein
LDKHGIEQNFSPSLYFSFLLSSSFSTPISLFFSFSFPIVGTLVGETTFTTHPMRLRPNPTPLINLINFHISTFWTIVESNKISLILSLSLSFYLLLFLHPLLFSSLSLSSSIPNVGTLVGETTFTTHPAGVMPQSCPSNQPNKLSHFNFSDKRGIEQNFPPPIFFSSFQFSDQRLWIEDHFPKDTRFETLIISSGTRHIKLFLSCYKLERLKIVL